MHEIRKDPLLNRWVLIAPDRAKRPQLLSSSKSSNENAAEILQAAIDSDPFLEGRESETPDELFAIRDPNSKPNGPGWRVRVVPNRFPAVSPDPEVLSQESKDVPPPLGVNAIGFGHHEVIVECPHYEENLENLSNSQIADVLIAYRERILELKQVDGIKHITIFKNQGEYAGASVGHSHSQLVASPFVPRTIDEEIGHCARGVSISADHFEYFKNLIIEERKLGDRLVEETDHFLVHCPFASRFPCETCIIPKFESARFEESNDEILFKLAELLGRTLRRLSAVLDDPPYNFVIHNLPFDEEPGGFRWHIEIYPRLSGIAGFEMGTDTYINPLPPEEAAQMLREADLSSGKN